MNITRENIDELNGLIRISIEKADYEASVEASLSEYRKKANMPGFRPGKIPVGLVKKMYGKAALVDEINKIQHLSILLVEQNARLALEVSDYAYIIEQGRIAYHDHAIALRNDNRIAKSYLGKFAKET